MPVNATEVQPSARSTLMKTRSTGVLSRKSSDEMKPMAARPGQGESHSDSLLCDREDFQRSHGCEKAISFASYLWNRTPATDKLRRMAS